MSVQRPLGSPFKEEQERDQLRPERLTIGNEDPDGFMPHTSDEGEASSNRWEPGPYVTAVREDLVSAFALAHSLPHAFQGTTPSTKPLRIQEVPSLTPRRTPIHGRPIILRDLRKHSSSLLTQEETSRLLRSVTQRDIAILQALHDYRYLTTLQIQQLFFHGLRSAQMRLRFLSDHGLIYRWQMIDPPGLTRRSSLLLLTPRGGRLLADFRGHSPWSYIRRAKDARDHCWHVTHDLEANGFFVDLALASPLSSTKAYCSGSARRAAAAADASGRKTIDDQSRHRTAKAITSRVVTSFGSTWSGIAGPSP